MVLVQEDVDQYPNDKLIDKHMMYIFKKALNSSKRTTVENAAIGAFMGYTVTKDINIIDRLTNTSKT